LDLPNLLRVLKEYAGPSEQTASLEGRPVCLIRRHEIDYHQAVFTTHEEYTYIDKEGAERTFHKDHPYAIVGFPELSFLLGNAGFISIKTYGSYLARAEQTIGSGRMIIIAGKRIGA
jgi:hypothetical protein